MSPAPAPANLGLAARVDQLTQQISQHETALNRASNTMLIVGLLALVLLSAYFYFGYHMIADLLEPKHLVPFGATMLESNLPTAREAIAKQVSDSAPAWAEQLSIQARNSLPPLRVKLEDYVLAQTGTMLGQAAKLTEEQFRTTIEENRELLNTGFTELAASETLSDESLQALVAALELQLQSDMKSDAETVLGTLQDLRLRVQRLQSGKETDEVEQIARRVLMIARRLQLMEADPQPIQPPALKFASTIKPPEKAAESESEAAKPGVADAGEPENRPDPAGKDEAPAKEKEVEPATENPQPKPE